MKIAVIGCWHQGVVGAACLADLGHSVKGFDSDMERVHQLNNAMPPLFEPGLNELLLKVESKGLLAFTDVAADAVAGCDVAMIMHDTPVDENDQSDLSGIYLDVESMAGSLPELAVVYVTAQVPVGTCDRLAEIIRIQNPGWRGGIAYSPENLRLGQAIERFRNPPLPVVGTDNDETFHRLEKLLADFPVKWKQVNLRTAEMSKHALNAFLATSICFANELGNLCDLLGADGHKLAEVLRLEPRIGPKAMLFPGLGFSGGTLARDMQTLRGFGDQLGIETRLLDGAWSSNQSQNQIVAHMLRRVLGGSLTQKTIAVLGLTYKPDTSTLRRSAALEVIETLEKEGATIRAHDPKADREELKTYRSFSVFDDPYEAATDADALVLMTPWPIYRELSPTRIRDVMRGNVVFDTANLWPVDEWEKNGLIDLTIGRGRKVQA